MKYCLLAFSACLTLLFGISCGPSQSSLTGDLGLENSEALDQREIDRKKAEEERKAISKKYEELQAKWDDNLNMNATRLSDLRAILHAEKPNEINFPKGCFSQYVFLKPPVKLVFRPVGGYGYNVEAHFGDNNRIIKSYSPLKDPMTNLFRNTDSKNMLEYKRTDTLGRNLIQIAVSEEKNSSGSYEVAAKVYTSFLGDRQPFWCE